MKIRNLWIVTASTFSLCAAALSETVASPSPGDASLPLSLGFTPLGWSPVPTPPAVSWGKGFLMVDVAWATPYTDKDDVRYEVWIENASNDWGSANSLLPSKTGGGARQMALLSAVRAGGLKGARLKMTFDYRAPGYSSAPIRSAGGKVRYEPLPAARPLSPGKYDFECVVTRCVSNATVVVSRKPFVITVSGTAEPVFFEGIENGRVYPRLTKTHGEIGFWIGSATPGAHTARVAVRNSAGVVSERSIAWSGTDERVAVSEIPTGGPYTVEIACEGVTKTCNEIYIGDLWILAGQSNAVGTGGDPSLGRKAVPGVQGLTPRYGILQWRAASDGFFESTVGAWVTAAQEFYAATGVPVGLLGFASGSKPIDYFFDESGEDLLQLRPLIERHGRQAAAFFWYQGESDSFAPEAWTVYGTKLAKLVTAVRRASDRPELDVGIVQLARYLWYRDDHFAPVREAQRQFVKADAHAALYATHPYDLHPGDKIHLLTPGYVALGQQIAKSRIACENTGRFTSPGPMVANVKFSGADRRRIVVRFENAGGLAGGEDVGEWSVTDSIKGGFHEGGFVPISAVKTDAATGCVSIDLSEPAGDGAALSYVYNCSAMGTLHNDGGVPAPAFVKVAVKP